MANRKTFVVSTKKHIEGLNKLLKYYGSQKAIGDSLGMARQSVYNWFSGRQVIPERHALRLAMQCQNKVTFEDLRPDYKKIQKKTCKE